MQMRAYFLHVGPSLPRHRHDQPMTLAQALHRAYGRDYADMYRLGDRNERIPVIADAGNPREVLHMPSAHGYAEARSPAAATWTSWIWPAQPSRARW
jgi:hypothetical protein